VSSFDGSSGVQLEAGVVGIGLVLHVVEDEELGFRADIDRVADAFGLHVGLGLLGRAARIAVIGLAGDRVQDVAHDDHGRLREERVHVTVSVSGISTMSDSLMAFQPAIEEPSNITPSANMSSSTARRRPS
jgi:hypothetical protein